MSSAASSLRQASALAAAMGFSLGGVCAQSPWPECLRGDHATGDWLGARDAMLERGVGVGLHQLTDWSVVASGGARSGHGVLRSLWDLELDLDGERLVGFSGSRFYVDFQVQNGRDGSLDSGDFQIYSNIDGPDRVQVAQVFYEQQLGDSGCRLKLGKFDSNEDFAFLESASVHVHSSFGFTPTIVGFPSYPDPAFGGAFFAERDDGGYLRAAIQDGATQSGMSTGHRGPRTLFGSPSDLFMVAEAGWHSPQSHDTAQLPLSVGAGWWRHTGAFEGRGAATVDGLDGGYLLFEKMVWRPGSEPVGGDRGLTLFAQYGHTDPAGSVAESYYGCGALLTGVGSQRPDDQIGVGVAWAEWRDNPGDGIRGAGEVTTELFYRAQLTPWLALMPDVQYVHDPGGRPELRDAWILTLRFAVTF